MGMFPNIVGRLLALILIVCGPETDVELLLLLEYVELLLLLGNGLLLLTGAGGGTVDATAPTGRTTA
jgi:hypothetical protein